VLGLDLIFFFIAGGQNFCRNLWAAPAPHSPAATTFKIDVASSSDQFFHLVNEIRLSMVIETILRLRHYELMNEVQESDTAFLYGPAVCKVRQVPT